MCKKIKPILLFLYMQFCFTYLTYAKDLDTTKSKFNDLTYILLWVLRGIGVLFIVIGIVKFAQAQSADDGGMLSKAILMLASGIAIIFLSFTLGTMGFRSLIPERDVDTSDTTGEIYGDQDIGESDVEKIEVTDQEQGEFGEVFT